MTESKQSIRCDYDGLKMAEVQNGHLILRAKHHGETHVKVVPLTALLEQEQQSENFTYAWYPDRKRKLEL